MKKILLRELVLRCKNSEERIKFGDTLSFFHGEMSAGKSTIVEMLKYCFGGNLVRTPAVVSEVIGVQLDFSIGDTEVLIERSISSSTTVDVTWQNGEEKNLQAFPIRAQQSPVYGDEIYNLSDFMLTLLGVSILKVRKRKSDPDSDLHRIGFRDFYLFNYLDQDDLDSSLFHLETPIRQEKSKDVLKYLIGFHSDQLNQIEVDIARLRQDQRVMRDSVKQIDEFLADYGFNSEQEIAHEIDKINSEAEKIETQLGAITADSVPKVTQSEEQAHEIKLLSQKIADKNKSIDDVNARLNDQEALFAELISMKFKVARSTFATDILEGADFQVCPSCGTDIAKPVDKHHCCLCKTDLSGTDEHAKLTPGVVSQDITDRIDDLARSKKRLQRALVSHEEEMARFLDERSVIQQHVDASFQTIESEYMARVRSLESTLGGLNERRRFLIRVKEMPSKIEARLSQADQLTEKIAKLERDRKKEQEKFSEGRKNLASLEQNFLKILQAIHFPAISNKDSVHVNTKTWMPYIHPNGDETRAWTFADAGSGGKKVLFKICYALALHVTVAEKSLSLPKLLIIDSTMKNITPDINTDIVNHFYKELYRLLTNELREWQCIIVDQTFFSPEDSIEGLVHRCLKKDDPDYPPLISYYHGH